MRVDDSESMSCAVNQISVASPVGNFQKMVCRAAELKSRKSIKASTGMPRLRFDLREIHFHVSFFQQSQ